MVPTFQPNAKAPLQNHERNRDDQPENDIKTPTAEHRFARTRLARFDPAGVTRFVESAEQERRVVVCIWRPADSRGTVFEINNRAPDPWNGTQRFGDMARAIVAGHPGDEEFRIQCS